jgi:hypothetical protein
MTAISYVSQSQMEEKTGFKHALGYALPEEDKILLRKGLTKDKKKEVLAHEEEHIAKGEEGPWVQFIPAIIAGVSALASSAQGKKAGQQAKKGAKDQMSLIDKWTGIARADSRHQRQAGATALNAMMSMTGLAGAGANGGGVQYDENGWPIENPGGGVMGGTAVAPTQMAEPRNVRGSQYGLVDKRFRGRVLNRYGGGPMERETIYNINEFGPENVYAGGSMTRNPNPMTIDGRTGYVEPNIQGAGFGDFLKKLANPKHHINPVEGFKTSVDPFGHLGMNKLDNTVKATSPTGGVQGGVQSDIDTTQGTDYNFRTDPGYQFRFEEGQRALDRGAAARGGLLSGGYGRKAIRYGQGFASNEYSNVYNRIANIAGMGQVANQFAGNAALQAGAGMGAAAGARGINSAYGDIGSGNAWANAGNQLAQLPWGDYFGGGGAVDNRPKTDFQGRVIQYQ